MKKAFLTLAILAIGCGDTYGPTSDRVCSQGPIASTEAAIYHGIASTDERSTVYLHTESGFCTGTKIAPNVFLTAKHCGNAIKVRSAFGGSADAVETIFHDTADLALVFTSFELTHIPASPIGIPVVGSALVQGFGVTETGEARQLRETTIEIEGFQGSKLFSALRETEGPDTCFGDSGGPVYQRGRLVGVTKAARGDAPDTCGFGGVYTIPALYADWINDETGVKSETCK